MDYVTWVFVSYGNKPFWQRDREVAMQRLVAPFKEFSYLINSKQVKLTRTLGTAFLWSLFSGKSTWLSAVLWVTRRCNLRCSYCYVSEPNGKDLPLEDAIRIIEKLSELGCRYLAFYGGEPTLNSGLTSMVRRASDLGMFTVCHTNGTLLTVDYVRELAEAGLDVFDIAVDYFEAYNSHKSVERVFPILRLLICESKRYGFEVKLNHCLSKASIANIDRIVALTDELHIPISIHLAIPDPFGLRQRPDGGWFQFPDDVEVVERMTETLIEKEKSGGLLVEPSQYFMEMARFFKGQRRWRCEAGLRSIAIDVDGRIMQCVSSVAEDLFLLRATGEDLSRVKRLFRQRLATCNSQCFSCASFDAAYFRRRPLQFLRKMYYWYKNCTRKRYGGIQDMSAPLNEEIATATNGMKISNSHCKRASRISDLGLFGQDTSHRLSAGTVGFQDLDEKGPEGLNGRPDAISPAIVLPGSRIQNVPLREELGTELDPFEKIVLENSSEMCNLGHR